MNSFSRPFAFAFTAALVISLLSGTARAHKVSAVSVVSEFDTREMTFKVELAMDVDPSGDPTVDDQIPPEAAARAFATESLQLYFDDQTVNPEPEIRVLTASDEDTPAELQRKKVVGTLSGKIPEGAENFLLRVLETTEAAVVMVTIKDGKPARRLQVLYPGEFSNPVGLAPVIEGDPFDNVDAPEKDASPSEVSETPSETIEGASSEATLSPSFGTWLVRGFKAIIPNGVDFWAFILAIFLFGLRSTALRWQLGLYTVAHSLALALGTFQLLKIPEAIYGPIVALSALVLALDNLFSKELKWWRGVAIVVFGLFHGLAFAAILDSWDPRVSELLPSLVAFNLGIEGAQFFLLLVVALIAIAFGTKAWFRSAVVIPLCILVAGISLFRFIDLIWLT